MDSVSYAGDGIAQRADAVYFGFDDIARLEVFGRRAGVADA